MPTDDGKKEEENTDKKWTENELPKRIPDREGPALARIPHPRDGNIRDTWKR